MTCQLLPLPAELRVNIYDHVITDEVVLPGPLPAGVAALLETSKQTSSEVLARLWSHHWVTWQGSLVSTTWNKFRDTAIPRIRRLTVMFNSDATWADCSEAESPHWFLGWLCLRSVPGWWEPWALQELTLRDVPLCGLPACALWWSGKRRRSYVPEYLHECRGRERGIRGVRWKLSEMEKAWIEELRRFGVMVTVDTQELHAVGYWVRLANGASIRVPPRAHATI